MNPDKRIIIDDLTARVNASPFLIDQCRSR